IAKVTGELQKEGFGILTEIDVKATMKKKLDLDFRRYVILGACNPHFASKMLAEEIEIGLLMPCNVIVYENDDRTATVALLSPKAQFQLVPRPDLAPMADEVERIIERVARAL
ncbi:MAG: DUF302 domain-containing protein, partial [Candidatus Zixiibacteriota bacterium]